MTVSISARVRGADKVARGFARTASDAKRDLRRVLGKAGEEWKEEVCFVDITVWGKQAENCAEYLSKGRPVFIDGRLQFSTWETDDGQKRNKLEVVANSVQFLGQGGGGKPGMQPDMEDAPIKDDIPF